DPFDGTIGGAPEDLAPADYKQVTVTVSCPSCQPALNPVSLTTALAPKNLESTGNNGALMIKVINASGQPISGASVHITNPLVSPAIDLTDTTDIQGNLLLVDVPPAQESYRIVISKSGYSTDRTYAPDDPIVINPLKPDATVIAQELTTITFAIDLLSQLNISTINSVCGAIANIPFNLSGAKLISQTPDVYKYNQNLTTDASGLKTLSNMEWDSYSVYPTSSSYELRGTIPLLPLNLSPASNQDLKLVMQTATPHSFLALVKDASTQLPLSGAAVKLTKASWSDTVLTSRGYLTQTEWKQGPGQEDFINPEKYFSDDGNIAVSNPAGQIKLKKIGSNYASDGWLISSTFDAGTAANPATISWQPGDQPPLAGSQPIKMQLASNNDQTTWNFV
ncbi:MAG: carboxypeptidase-like regulatory domain-containing protein, partial [Patescibacteria group bacterium]